MSDDEGSDCSDDGRSASSPVKGSLLQDGHECVICFEPFTNSGNHRPSCLRCGHIFGHSCILKCLKTSPKCPQCIAAAIRMDVRVLYATQISALDTVDRDRAIQEMQMARFSSKQSEHEITRQKSEIQAQHAEIVMLRDQLRAAKDLVARQERKIDKLQSNAGNLCKNCNNLSQSVVFDTQRPCSSQSFSWASNTFPAESEHQDNKKVGIFEIALDGAGWTGIAKEFQIWAYNKWSNTCVVSYLNQSSYFSRGSNTYSYGIRVFNWKDLRKGREIGLHSREITDIAFSPSANQILLTVGLDSRACLTNVNINSTKTVPDAIIPTEGPILACVFSTVETNVVYFGMENGKVLKYDIHRPTAASEKIYFLYDDSPVQRLHFIPPNHSGFSTSAGGLFVQKLTHCWFIELRGSSMNKFHKLSLPFEGKILASHFEPVSGRILVSMKPSTDQSQNQPTHHLVCDLITNANKRPSLTIVQQYLGGESLERMYRPKLFSPTLGICYLAVANSRTEVDIWDVSTSDNKQRINLQPSASSQVLDFIPFTYNNSYFITFVNNDGLWIAQSKY